MRTLDEMPVLSNTPGEWLDYIEKVQHQMALVDQLTPQNKRIVHELGYDGVLVRRMLADQRRPNRDRRGG
jgi:hypothetical protein